MSRDSSYAIKLGHHELAEARRELDDARRLAQELLRDTVGITAQRDELLAACEEMLSKIGALRGADAEDGDVGMTFSDRDLAKWRATIAKAKAR